MKQEEQLKNRSIDPLYVTKQNLTSENKNKVLSLEVGLSAKKRSKH